MMTEKKDDDIIHTLIEGYEGRLNTLMSKIEKDERGCKHNIVVDFCSYVNGNCSWEDLRTTLSLVDDYISLIRRKDGESDFWIIVLIRVLYLTKAKRRDENILKIHDKIEAALDTFLFWPRRNKNFPDSIVFWSENHILAMLSSAVLYQQWKDFRDVEREIEKMSISGPCIVSKDENEPEEHTREDTNEANTKHDGKHDIMEGTNSKDDTKDDAKGGNKDDTKDDTKDDAEGGNKEGTNSKDDTKDDAESGSQDGSKDDKDDAENGSKDDNSLDSSERNDASLHRNVEKQEDTENTLMEPCIQCEVQGVNSAKSSYGSYRSDINDGISLEKQLLAVYLFAHVGFNGEYESCSHVYLPYSLSSLLNLVDFSEDVHIQEKARKLVDLMLSHLLACTSDQGVSNLSVSLRSFIRTRLRNWGHSINPLIYLLIDKSPEKDPLHSSILTGFFVTSHWRPSAQDTFCFYRLMTMQTITLNHPLDDIEDIYAKNNLVVANLYKCKELPNDEFIPFYWSAGLVLHPRFVPMTLLYQRTRKMNKNVHLHLLADVPEFISSIVLNNADIFATGQCYCGGQLKSYRLSGGVVLSCVENICRGSSSFQQLLWMANIGGVGVWSTSGAPSSKLGNFGIANTHAPYVCQKDNFVVVAYQVPSRIGPVIGTFMSTQVRMFWPNRAMDETRVFPDDTKPKKSLLNKIFKTPNEYQANRWWFGRKKDAYVGIFCNKETMEEHGSPKDATLQPNETTSVTLKRRVCNEKKHAWIIVVGSASSHYSFDNFCSMYSSLVLIENNPHEPYEVELGKTIKCPQIVVRCE